MKSYYNLFIWFCLFCTIVKSQVSFILPANACIGDTLSLTANTSTLVNPQITWLASPNAVFSNSIGVNTSITFSASGNYTVLLVAISGTALGFTQNTINVLANPSPTLIATSASVCPGSTFSITASPLSGANYSFGLPGPVSVANGSSNVLQINPPTILPAVFEVSVELGGCIGTSTVAVQQLQLNPQIVATSSNVCVGFGATLTVFAGTQANYTFSILSPSPSTIQSGSTQSFVASPTVPTIYQVTTETLGCTGTASISIGILPPLQINVSASSATTCIMGNFPKISKLVTLTPMGASFYTWDPPIPQPGPWPLPGPWTVRPLQTTCYTITGMTQVCSGSAVICVTVTPQFTFALNPASSEICLGNTIAIVAGNFGSEAHGPVSGFTFSWTESNLSSITMDSYFSQTVNVFPTVNSTYTVEVTDTQTCVSLPQVATVQVFQCTDLSEAENWQTQISIYPNPVEDVCEIKISDKGFSEVQMFDLNVCLIKTFSSPDGKYTQVLELDLSEIPAGVYFIRTRILGYESKFKRLVKL